MRNPVVSHEEWLKARLELLTAEKEFTRQRDALTRRRRRCPGSVWKSPTSLRGRMALSRSPISSTGAPRPIVYHFMFGPDWEMGEDVTKSANERS
jgi:predicted dithiol-disulfide oxidoreductase (DUF899 family)